MDKEEVLKLARLARIKLDPEEAEALSHEFDAILRYVGEVKGIKSEGDAPKTPIRNVFRSDENPHESGLYTDLLIEQAPESEAGFIKVKKIL